ncbi:MAG TPA: hypothetical protein VK501_12990 [Baekduia sp.]|uniref:hypothetical protein n=1 Tax=Baekduia sp. TaxID=2600305 RepID=UPI002C01F10B|nr:hypothetical protein [Baekduia sp.]HMJ34822.1 hypothetical protein [Baekduia sp.]
METLTPTELAVELWGTAENDSHSQGARQVRRTARSLFPADAPGMGGHWHLTPAQVQAIRAEVMATAG